jgi:hypothetical protein
MRVSLEEKKEPHHQCIILAIWNETHIFALAMIFPEVHSASGKLAVLHQCKSMAYCILQNEEQTVTTQYSSARG